MVEGEASHYYRTQRRTWQLPIWPWQLEPEAATLMYHHTEVCPVCSPPPPLGQSPQPGHRKQNATGARGAACLDQTKNNLEACSETLLASTLYL